jgi:hypothetical protein
VIEVNDDDIPAKPSWTLRESANVLVASQSTGSFSTEGGVVSKTAYITEGAHTFELTDMCRDGICCQYGTA